MATKKQLVIEAKQAAFTLKVFISYSTKDLAIAEQVRSAVSTPRVKTFLAETSILPGASLTSSIQTEIRGCDVFILLWSASSQASEWVRDEIGMARGLGKYILPIVLDERAAIPPFLADTKYVAAFRAPAELLAQVAEVVRQRAVTKTDEHRERQTSALLLAVAGIGVLAALSRK